MNGKWCVIYYSACLPCVAETLRDYFFTCSARANAEEVPVYFAPPEGAQNTSCCKRKQTLGGTTQSFSFSLVLIPFFSFLCLAVKLMG